MAIIARICTRAGLSVHLKLANIIASKSKRGSRSEVVLADVVVLPDSDFFIFRLT